MIARMPGEQLTFNTRFDSHVETCLNKEKRYKQILECFREQGQMTAKECAVAMCKKGYIPTSERNYTAPRLTELSKIGVLEPVGKKKCAFTGKTVAVYGMRS